MTMQRTTAPDEVTAIRVRYARGEPATSIGRDFGLSTSGTWAIATGRTHREVALVDMSRRVRRQTRLRGDEHPLRRRPDLACRGESHPNHKLTERDVVAIRARAAAGEEAISLGHAYGVSRSCIQLVAARKRWRHVPAPVASTPRTPPALAAV